MTYIVKDSNGFIVIITRSKKKAYEIVKLEKDATIKEVSKYPNDNKEK